MMHLDTSFLVDLLRESRRGHHGPASAFLDTVEGEELRVGVHVVCELLAGAELSRPASAERQRVHRLCGSLHIVYPDERFPAAYARLLASQERTRQRIATMDLLIATAAVVEGAPLVTRNVKDFSRVSGLEVVPY
jgi:predicted nucleic acid-binding protein